MVWGARTQKIINQTEVIDRKISRFLPGTVGGNISLSRLLSIILLTVSLALFSLFAFVTLVSVIVDGGWVHQLEDATRFPLMV